MCHPVQNLRILHYFQSHSYNFNCKNQPIGKTFQDRRNLGATRKKIFVSHKSLSPKYKTITPSTRRQRRRELARRLLCFTSARTKSTNPPERRAFPQGQRSSKSCQVPRPKAHPPWALGYQPQRNFVPFQYPFTLHSPNSQSNASLLPRRDASFCARRVVHRYHESARCRFGVRTNPGANLASANAA
jgi:hypothetical protein